MINFANLTALATIMLSMGMQVKLQAVVASTSPFRRVALGLLANFILVPLVTVGLLYAFQAETMISVGFLILAVCPGAPVGPPATTIARGNIAWAIGIMVILAALSAVLSPALLGLLLAKITPDTDLQIDPLAIARTLAVVQLLPLAIGLAIHQWAPKFTQKVVKPVGVVANLMLLALIGLILATQYETLADIGLRGWLGMSLLYLASLTLGWICGGKELGIRKALALTTACRNAAVGLAIVNSNFAGTPAVTAVVAYALVSIVGTLGCAVLFRKIGSL